MRVFFSHTPQLRWLPVEVTHPGLDPRALTECLPDSGGVVLITSRNPHGHVLATPVSVEVFDRQESINCCASGFHSYWRMMQIELPMSWKICRWPSTRRPCPGNLPV